MLNSSIMFILIINYLTNILFPTQPLSFYCCYIRVRKTMTLRPLFLLRSPLLKFGLCSSCKGSCCKAGVYCSHPKSSFVVLVGGINVNTMKPRTRTRTTRRRRRSLTNLLTSLPKILTRKKAGAAQKRMKWQLPWRQSSMTLFDVKNKRTRTRDNKKLVLVLHHVVKKVKTKSIFLL